MNYFFKSFFPYKKLSLHYLFDKKFVKKEELLAKVPEILFLEELINKLIIVINLNAEFGIRI